MIPLDRESCSAVESGIDVSGNPDRCRGHRCSGSVIRVMTVGDVPTTDVRRRPTAPRRRRANPDGSVQVELASRRRGAQGVGGTPTVVVTVAVTVVVVVVVAVTVVGGCVSVVVVVAVTVVGGCVNVVVVVAVTVVGGCVTVVVTVTVFWWSE